jgi:hypothetical protein
MKQHDKTFATIPKFKQIYIFVDHVVNLGMCLKFIHILLGSFKKYDLLNLTKIMIASTDFLKKKSEFLIHLSSDWSNYPKTSNHNQLSKNKILNLNEKNFMNKSGNFNLQ